MALVSRLRPICTAVMAWFCFFAPSYDVESWPQPSTVMMTVALAASLFAATAVAVFPKYQSSCDVVLFATTLLWVLFKVSYFLWALPLKAVHASPGVAWWMYGGPGGAILGWLPAALAYIAIGKYVFGMPLNEQWGGRLRMSWIDWRLGLPIGMILALLIVTASKLAGDPTYWDFSATGIRVPVANCFSNLYEEILARGLLLQLTLKHLGKIPAIIWTSIIFGPLMHGPGPQGFAIAILALPFAWAVLRSKSLWCSWVIHETVDALVDPWLMH